MTDDDAHPDRSARPIRVARFDLTGRPEPDASADASIGDGLTADESVAGQATAPRVARLDGLDPATAGQARVAAFDGLDDAGTSRSLAPVIPLGSIGRRRGAGARRSPAEPSPRTSGAVAEDDAPPRELGQDPAPRRARPPRRPAEAGLSGDFRAADEDAAPDESAGRIPPDGPLPRGRRKRARAGRLGPGAPDPELPLPEADPVAIAREICLRLLTDRARTRQELAQALARKGVPEEAASAVLDRFAEVGLIDDAAFAGQWVRSRHTYRGLGRRAIAVELRRKGVADGVAKEALAEVDTESEDRRARELVDRKLRSMTVGTPDQRAKAAQRLVGMLARKGYGAATAYRVVREALAEHGAAADELGTDLDG